MSPIPLTRQNLFSLFLTAGFVFAIMTNLDFLTKSILQEGGGMRFALVEAEKEVFREVYGREPEGHELYLRHEELMNQFLLIEWHDDFLDRFREMEVQLEKGGRFYLLARSRESEAVPRLQKRQFQVELVKAIDFLDAPTLAFKVQKAVRSLLGKKKKREILVFRCVKS